MKFPQEDEIDKHMTEKQTVNTKSNYKVFLSLKSINIDGSKFPKNVCCLSCFNPASIIKFVLLPACIINTVNPACAFTLCH